MNFKTVFASPYFGVNPIKNITVGSFRIDYWRQCYISLSYSLSDKCSLPAKKCIRKLVFALFADGIVDFCVPDIHLLTCKIEFGITTPVSISPTYLCAAFALTDSESVKRLTTYCIFYAFGLRALKSCA